MLLSNLNRVDLADYSPILQNVLKIFRKYDFKSSVEGRIVVDSNTYIQVLTYETKDITKDSFECHQKYMDVHYILEGKEIIDVSSEIYSSFSDNYDEQRDIEYFDPPKGYNSVVLKAGDFLIIGLNELHRTNGRVSSESDLVKKIVVKIRREDK